MMSWTGINLISFNKNKKIKPHLFSRSFIIPNKKKSDIRLAPPPNNIRPSFTQNQPSGYTNWMGPVITGPSLKIPSLCGHPDQLISKVIDLLESTQRVFTRSIRGMDGKDYAQCLNKLPISSIQRRHERYKILYAYKVKEGLVPNISKTHGLKFINTGRCGCRCGIPRQPYKR